MARHGSVNTPGRPRRLIDTIIDGNWYSGDSRVQSIGNFGSKPFPHEVGNGKPTFFFPLATH